MIPGPWDDRCHCYGCRRRTWGPGKLCYAPEPAGPQVCVQRTHRPGAESEPGTWEPVFREVVCGLDETLERPAPRIPPASTSSSLRLSPRHTSHPKAQTTTMKLQSSAPSPPLPSHNAFISRQPASGPLHVLFPLLMCSPQASVGTFSMLHLVSAQGAPPPPRWSLPHGVRVMLDHTGLSHFRPSSPVPRAGSVRLLSLPAAQVLSKQCLWMDEGRALAAPAWEKRLPLPPTQVQVRCSTPPPTPSWACLSWMESCLGPLCLIPGDQGLAGTGEAGNGAGWGVLVEWSRHPGRQRGGRCSAWFCCSPHSVGRRSRAHHLRAALL